MAPPPSPWISAKAIIIHQTGDRPDPEPRKEPVDVRALVQMLRRETAELKKRENQNRKALEEARDELGKAETESLRLKGTVAELEIQGEEARRLANDLRAELGKEKRLRERAEAERAEAAEKLTECGAETAKLEETLASQRVLLEEKERELAALNDYLTQRSDSLRKAGVSATEGSANLEAVAADAAPLLSEGYSLLGQGQYEDAANAFRRGQARWPDAAAFRIGLAACHYEQGNLDVADSIVRYVIDADEDDAEAHGLLGMIQWRREDLRGAARSLARAVRLRPNDERLRVYHGMVLYARGKQREAVRELQEAVKLNPLNVEAQFNLSVALAGTGEEEQDLLQARIHYEEAVRLGASPDDPLEQILYQD